MTTARRRFLPIPPQSAFAGFRFPSDVIVVAVRWYVTITAGCSGSPHCWPGPPCICRHGVGDRWRVDETYVNVVGRWRCVDLAIDQFGQVIGVFVCPRRGTTAARRFFDRTIATTW
jgi:transposase-like protein